MTKKIRKKIEDATEQQVTAALAELIEQGRCACMLPYLVTTLGIITPQAGVVFCKEPAKRLSGSIGGETWTGAV